MANGRKSTGGAKQYYNLKMLSKSASQRAGNEQQGQAVHACVCEKLSMQCHRSKPKLGEDQTTCSSIWFSLPEARQIPHFQTSRLGTRGLKMWGLPGHQGGPSGRGASSSPCSSPGFGHSTLLLCKDRVRLKSEPVLDTAAQGQRERRPASQHTSAGWNAKGTIRKVQILLRSSLLSIH